MTWIDDHLKYSLHRELRDFLVAGLENDPVIGGARLRTVCVRKARQPFKNLLKYTLTEYLPTLLYGTIVDAWLTPNPLLKFRMADLESSADKESLANLRKEVEGRPETESQASLAAAMKEALERGNLPSGTERKLRLDLLQTALERINKVRGTWGQLRSEDHHTFAAAWADGTAAQLVPFLWKNPGDQNGLRNDGIGRGIASGKTEIKELTDLEPHLMVGLLELIEDAVQYITWTLEWPRFIQTVLSFPHGTFITDPPYTERQGPS